MLKGLGDLGNMANVMKQAKEMQAKMAEVEETLEKTNAVGQSGAGMVVATVSAKGVVKSLEIDPSLLRPEDKEVVEDLIVAALKDAQAKGKEARAAEMAKIAEGLNLPAGMTLPF